MDIYLSNRKERAIMAYAIKKVHEIHSKRSEGGYLGRTALQKIMYFLVRKGVPLPYKFEIYHYGPFCSDIYHDVDCLQVDGIIQNQTPDKHYWNFVPDENMDDYLEKHEKIINRYKHKIDEVVEMFPGLSPKDLELISTLDYTYQDEKAKSKSSPEKQKVVDRFLKIKKEKYTREKIESTYAILLQKNFFE